MKKIILTLFILFTLAGCNRQEWLGARTSDFWKTVGNNLRPIDDNYNVQIPSLSNCNTIDTDAWGKLVCGTDEVGGGGGGSGLWATSSDELLIYPLSNRAVVVGGSATTSDVQFEVTGASKLNSLFIDEDGNVGIGTDEPSEDLEVVGTIYANAIQREGTDDLTIGNTNNGIFHIGGNGADSIMSTISNNLVYKWHRNSPSTYAQIIKFQGEIGSDIQTYFKVGGHPNATDSAYQTPYTHFYTEAYFDDNVGIGTTSPSQKLSVEGNVLADNYYGTWQGSPITDTYVADDITTSNYLSLTAWYSTTTDAIVEGSNNLYWTQTRFNSAFSAKTTDDLAEGSINKYYSTNLFAADLAATTTNALSEGTTNLYYTNGRVDSHLSGGTGITYSSGNISFDCSEVEGTGINCSGESITLDNTGDWTGTLDGYEGTAFVLRNDWTTIDNYPTGCSAGEYVQAIGDTLTCATDQNTTYTAGGTLLQLSGTQFSLKEGTLTSGKICKYDSTNGLVCNYDDQNTTYTAGNGLQLSTNEFSIDSPTCSGDDKLQWNGTAFVCDVDNNTTYTAGGTLLQLSGTQFSLKEGTLTDGKLCRYDTTDGLVCDYTDQTGGGGSGSGTVETGVAGQVAYYETSTSTVSGTSTIFITPEGDVGVGTTTPDYNLEVAGQIKATKAISAGFNKETLSADKTLTVGEDAMFQYLSINANRTITLSTTNAKAGDMFVIRNDSGYADVSSLKIQEGTTILDYINSGGIKKFIFDGTHWVSGENGTGENDNKKYNVSIGYGAGGVYQGTAVGYYAAADTQGTAVGYDASAFNYGTAIGYKAYGYYGGTAIGYDANGREYGVSIGNGSYGYYYGTAVGAGSKGMRGGVSVGYQAGYYLNTSNYLYNTLIGYKAGADSTYKLETGSYNILLGANTYTPTTDTDRFLNIGNLIFATNVGTTTGVVSTDGKVGIGTTTPAMTFSVQGDALADSWNVYSNIYQGDALTKLAKIRAEEGEYGDWVKVNHKSLPDGVYKAIPISYDKPLYKISSTTEGVYYVRISDGKKLTPEEYKKIDKKYEHIEYTQEAMDISALAQMNTKAILQLNDKIKNIKKTQTLGIAVVEEDKLCLGETCITEQELKEFLKPKKTFWQKFLTKLKNLWKS